MKKALKIIGTVFLVLLLAVALFFLYLTAVEYKPGNIAPAPLRGEAEDALVEGESVRLLSWNIGYAGLGAASDFFMDGGRAVRAADRAAVSEYLSGIHAAIDNVDADIVLLQEVDENSTRTFGVNEVEALSDGISAFTYNYKCPFVPYPLPPIGRVNSGLLTCSDYPIDSAERQALPCPFQWPVRLANLKRCLLVSYLPIEGSEHQLVLVNLHLEAYDDGEGKLAQTEQLRSFIQSEYEKGNYVIAGGDFNQEFPGGYDVYADLHTDLWAPGNLGYDLLPDGWNYAYDLSVPTCRLLNQPYQPADEEGTQYYFIDGYILSPNIQLDSVETIDLGFADSDHNPVALEITLIPEQPVPAE